MAQFGMMNEENDEFRMMNDEKNMGSASACGYGLMFGRRTTPFIIHNSALIILNSSFLEGR
jgi:hypothetical protein